MKISKWPGILSSLLLGILLTLFCLYGFWYMAIGITVTAVFAWTLILIFLKWADQDSQEYTYSTVPKK